ncbi:hypothetical protein [Treponema sp. OMZ 857]|uniref:hypothetical protein n=1 Tax=Treponema sp. OMZ 857 TaxID=1643513 RepID=UPI0020A2A22C|nr:hypothetical protein [Treponema sp. OMZ 857]UTC44011.1 hypothetical protein E4N66_07965 [Treponema sp. OMZ 857]
MRRIFAKDIAFSSVCLYNIFMLNQRIVLPQYQLSSHNVQKGSQKILDTYITCGDNYSATQQLSNSATQQLSNSATQQLSNSATQQLSNSATQQLSNSATQQLSNSATQQLKA